ncbi:hypothetical protein ACJRO7_028832 [Eucalyptus globulus]|uniref:Uncharacterized protein n=1 Tax=Eucalyptus globulus TaxID=34317 RepID=A0ABD3JVW4_EUCGL
MAITTSKRVGSVLLVAALILWSSMGADADVHTLSFWKRIKCSAKCFKSLHPNLFACVFRCLNDKSKESLMSASEHCDVGCFLSTCLNHHHDTKKVGVDVKKVRTCADSCSQSCRKTHSLN